MQTKFNTKRENHSLSLVRKIKFLSQILAFLLIFTLPSYGEDGVFTSANAYENPKQSQNSYKKFAIEFGAGYINSSFEAKQNFGTLSHKVKSDRAHGLDLFVNFNYKFHQKFGLLVGLDLEFLPISWQNEGVWDAEYMTIFKNQTDLSYNSSDFLFNTNLNFGVFSDVYEGTSSSVRIFASVGLGLNYFLGDGRYEGEESCSSTHSCEIEYNMIPYAFSMPVSLGRVLALKVTASN